MSKSKKNRDDMEESDYWTKSAEKADKKLRFEEEYGKGRKFNKKRHKKNKKSYYDD